MEQSTEVIDMNDIKPSTIMQLTLYAVRPGMHQHTTVGMMENIAEHLNISIDHL